LYTVFRTASNAVSSSISLGTHIPACRVSKKDAFCKHRTPFSKGKRKASTVNLVDILGQSLALLRISVLIHSDYFGPNPIILPMHLATRHFAESVPIFFPSLQSLFWVSILLFAFYFTRVQ